MGGAWPRVHLVPSPRCWSQLSLGPLRHARGDFRTNVGHPPQWERMWVSAWSGNTNRSQTGVGNFLPDRCAWIIWEVGVGWICGGLRFVR